MIALIIPVKLSETIPATDAEVRLEAALDERALEAMLQAYGGQIKGVLLQRYATAFGAADVDDVMTVAAERLWRNRDKFDPNKGGLKAWYFRIADNTARDVLRIGWFKARKLEVVVDQRALDALAAVGDDSEDAVGVVACTTQDSAAREVLLKVLGGLPEPQRRILWADALSSSGPVPTVDLARELKLSRGTVRVYRAKALARLREELGKHPIFDHLKDTTQEVEASS
jgi:RNA polymerase sigma factor (sigma-70 family)